MDCCPYCGQQVMHRKKASTGIEVIICPKHGEMPAFMAIKGK